MPPDKTHTLFWKAEWRKKVFLNHGWKLTTWSHWHTLHQVTGCFRQNLKLYPLQLLLNWQHTFWLLSQKLLLVQQTLQKGYNWTPPLLDSGWKEGKRREAVDSHYLQHLHASILVQKSASLHTHTPQFGRANFAGEGVCMWVSFVLFCF